MTEHSQAVALDRLRDRPAPRPDHGGALVVYSAYRPVPPSLIPPERDFFDVAFDRAGPILGAIAASLAVAVMIAQAFRYFHHA